MDTGVVGDLGGGGGQSVAPLQNPGSAPRDDPLMGSKASGTAAGGFGVNNNIFISKNYVLLGGWVWVCGWVWVKQCKTILTLSNRLLRLNEERPGRIDFASRSFHIFRPLLLERSPFSIT